MVPEYPYHHYHHPLSTPGGVGGDGGRCGGWGWGGGGDGGRYVLPLGGPPSSSMSSLVSLARMSSRSSAFVDCRAGKGGCLCIA